MLEKDYFTIDGVEFEGGACITSGASDPSTALVDLPQGSLYLRTNGDIWKKIGPVSNEWELVTGGGGTSSSNLDGGSASSVYLVAQQINAGGAGG